MDTNKAKWFIIVCVCVCTGLQQWESLYSFSHCWKEEPVSSSWSCLTWNTYSFYCADTEVMTSLHHENVALFVLAHPSSRDKEPQQRKEVKTHLCDIYPLTARSIYYICWEEQKLTSLNIRWLLSHWLESTSTSFFMSLMIHVHGVCIEQSPWLMCVLVVPVWGNQDGLGAADGWRVWYQRSQSESRAAQQRLGRFLLRLWALKHFWPWTCHLHHVTWGQRWRSALSHRLLESSGLLL